MAIPIYTDCCRPACAPGISSQQALLMSTAIIALTFHGGSSLPIQQQPRTPTDQNRPNNVLTNALNTIKQNRSCFVNPFDSSFSGSLGDELEYCAPGTRMTSDANPCPDGQPCCACEHGTFQPEESFCDTCWNHTKCATYKRSGDAISDSVCEEAIADRPDSGDNQDVTTDPPLIHPPDAGTEPEEVDTGQDVTTDPPSIHPPDTGTKRDEVDTGQDEQNSGSKFSIEHPYSVIAMVALSVMLLVIIALAILIFRYIRRRSGTYGAVSPTPATSHAQTHFESSDSNGDEDATSQEEI